MPTLSMPTCSDTDRQAVKGFIHGLTATLNLVVAGLEIVMVVYHLTAARAHWRAR